MVVVARWVVRWVVRGMVVRRVVRGVAGSELKGADHSSAFEGI